MNSRSHLIYVIARPFILSLSSVMFVGPTQLVEIFGNVSMPFVEIVPGEPLSQGS